MQVEVEYENQMPRLLSDHFARWLGNSLQNCQAVLSQIRRLDAARYFC